MESGKPAPAGSDQTAVPVERRPNVGGSTRAVRLTTLYVVVLTIFYAGFVLADRAAPGGTSSTTTNGLLMFTGVYLLLAAIGAVYALQPSPRAVEVAPDHVTVVGRWGRRRRFPPLSQLSVSVVRRYPAGWLAPTPVELVELWGEGVPRRSYVVDPGLFEGAKRSDRDR